MKFVTMMMMKQSNGPAHRRQRAVGGSAEVHVGEGLLILEDRAPGSIVFRFSLLCLVRRHGWYHHRLSGMVHWKNYNLVQLPCANFLCTKKPE